VDFVVSHVSKSRRGAPIVFVMRNVGQPATQLVVMPDDVDRFRISPRSQRRDLGHPVGGEEPSFWGTEPLHEDIVSIKGWGAEAGDGALRRGSATKQFDHSFLKFTDPGTRRGVMVSQVSEARPGAPSWW
jgi:hypothetical protein